MLNLLPPLVYALLVLLKASVRIEHMNREAAERLWRQGDNIIACFWHGRLLAMPFAYNGQRAKVLISRHRDGEFIARIIRYFGLGAVRGSYRKGGSISSVREMLTELKQGADIGITPDGPKGPRYRVKEGVVELARITRKPILPISYSASRKRVFRSWDHFLLPYPFSKILFVWGDPIYVTKDTKGNALEAKRLEVETMLNALTEKADRLACGD
jgi:hypothetical protein